MKKQEKLEKLKKEMKKLAQEISLMELKRGAAGAGLTNEYTSRSELKKKQIKFARLQSQHKKLYFNQ